MAPHVKKLNLIAALALLLALAAAPALANMSGSAVDSVSPNPTVRAPANVSGSAVDSVSPNPTARAPKSMSGSTVNSVTPNPISSLGVPLDLCFNVTVSSPDDEYLARFDVNLPDGWTVNSVANTPSNTGASTTQGTEAGNVVYWRTTWYWGAWSNGTFDFCANVTIPDNTGAPWSLPWNLIGDYSSINGTITLKGYQPQLALAKSVTPATNAPYHGVVTCTLALQNTGPVSDTAVFLTDTLPAAVDFGWWIDNPGASVNNDEITWNGTLTNSSALTFTFAVTHTGNYAQIVANTAMFSGTLQTGSASASFAVEISPNAPVLQPIGDQTVDELTELAFTATATDPVHTVLTFTLDAGSVGTITPGGDYSWTPTEADGPGVYNATVRVTNGEYENFETIAITVNEVNTAPELPYIGWRVVNEWETLSFMATATDADLPPNTLAYSLDDGSVGEIDDTTGRYTWTPTEADGFGAYTATVRVSDGSLEDSEFFIIVVDEVYQPPVLQPIGDQVVEALTPFHLTARIAYFDHSPLRPMTYTLAPGSVGTIDAHTGQFSWTPGNEPETYSATVQVSDGTVTDTETFHLTVNVDTPGRGQWMVVANSYLSNFRIVDTVDDQVYGPFLDGQLGSEGGGRFDAAVTPDGSTALISNFGDSTVYLVDMTNPITPSLIPSVTIPFFAEDIDVSADGHYALVADGGFSPRLATIDIPAATLVYTADLGAAYANGVVVAPNGTIIVPDYFAGSIHTLLLDDMGRVLNTGNTYTYTYPGLPITDINNRLWPVNLGLSPDGQTLIVCDSMTTTVGIYRIV